MGSGGKGEQEGGGERRRGRSEEEGPQGREKKREQIFSLVEGFKIEF